MGFVEMIPRRRAVLVAASLLGLIWLATLTACTSSKTPTLEDRIREYLYKYQPTTGDQFAQWANREFAAYSPREVFEALRAEGRLQARLGHPNMVGVLSFCASEWARQKGQLYSVNEWLALQEEAKKNLRDEPGDLKLWPTTPK
jgi:hypothetical protein